MRKRREDLDLAAYDYGFLVCAKGGRGKTVPSFKGVALLGCPNLFGFVKMPISITFNSGLAQP